MWNCWPRRPECGEDGVGVGGWVKALYFACKSSRHPLKGGILQQISDIIAWTLCPKLLIYQGITCKMISEPSEFYPVVQSFIIILSSCYLLPIGQWISYALLCEITMQKHELSDGFSYIAKPRLSFLVYLEKFSNSSSWHQSFSDAIKLHLSTFLSLPGLPITCHSIKVLWVLNSMNVHEDFRSHTIC